MFCHRERVQAIYRFYCIGFVALKKFIHLDLLCKSLDASPYEISIALIK